MICVKNLFISLFELFYCMTQGFPFYLQDLVFSAKTGFTITFTDEFSFIHRLYLPSGQLVDFVKRVEQRAPMSCDTVLKIFFQTCRAVQHMHKQKPSIIHRDLKVGLCLAVG